MVGILFLLMSLVDASQFQWAITEQFSSSSCAIADLTKTQELGRVGTVALGLGCGDSSAKAYVVQGTDLVTESHSTADCSGTPLANSTTMLDTCAESSTAGVYEKTKVVTLPATSTTVYNQGDDNCSNSHLGIYVGALELCHFDSNVPGKKSRKTLCQGDKTWNCYYSNSDCTGDDFCSPSSNTLNSCYETGGRYAITTVLGSSSEIASICPTTTTTTTTPFTGISGNISVYGDGTCSTLTGTYPVNLGQCMPTGAGTQKWECSAGSISHLTYATADCSGIVVTNGPYEQGPCVPQDNGTSSWLLDFAGCTSTPISSSKGQLFSLTILGFACNLVAG